MVMVLGTVIGRPIGRRRRRSGYGSCVWEWYYGDSMEDRSCDDLYHHHPLEGFVTLLWPRVVPKQPWRYRIYQFVMMNDRNVVATIEERRRRMYLDVVVGVSWCIHNRKTTTTKRRTTEVL